MTQSEVAAYLLARYHVPRETIGKLEMFASMLIAENEKQNLIAQSTEARIWDRHILDSAQLIGTATGVEGRWLDVGSGAGLPGIVLSLLTKAKHILVEPRRLRAEFLDGVVVALGLSERVQIVRAKIEKLPPGAMTVITARAFASLSATLAATRHLADQNTVWLLHKGRNAASEVREARGRWRASFEQMASMTDADARIVKVSRLTGPAS